ncbi:MAG TPA: hypothetical protein PLH94_06055 [Fimbriimonadaceae bacterium]|nr:hypothetical protein [Fimbriimonadaceae bacterium]
MAKISRPVIYTVLLAVVAYAGVVLTEPDPPKSTSKPKPRASASTPKGMVYTEADYRAKFGRIDSAPKNAFQPVIARKGGPNSLDALRLDSIPTAFTGGDPNWRYTGNAEQDGDRVALLENSSTGEGVFLRVGETWKQAVLTSIEDDAVVMVGPNGSVRRIRLGSLDQEAPTQSLPGIIPSTAGLQPMRVSPNLTGRIGQDTGLSASAQESNPNVVNEDPIPDVVPGGE